MSLNHHWNHRSPKWHIDTLCLPTLKKPKRKTKDCSKAPQHSWKLIKEYHGCVPRTISRGSYHAGRRWCSWWLEFVCENCKKKEMTHDLTGQRLRLREKEIIENCQDVRVREIKFALQNYTLTS